MTLAAVFLIARISALPSGVKDNGSCCAFKIVGGVNYTYVGEQDTKQYNCLSHCVYETTASPGVQYCFAAGALPVECEPLNTCPGKTLSACQRLIQGKTPTCNVITTNAGAKSTCCCHKQIRDSCNEDPAKTFCAEF